MEVTRNDSTTAPKIHVVTPFGYARRLALLAAPLAGNSAPFPPASYAVRVRLGHTKPIRQVQDHLMEPGPRLMLALAALLFLQASRKSRSPATGM